MKTLCIAVALFVLAVSTQAQKEIPPLTPVERAAIKELPRDEGAWEFKWKSDHKFKVVEVVYMEWPALNKGFSVVKIEHQTADFAEYALALPGREPRVDDLVLTRRMELKTESGEGPFYTFVRESPPGSP